MSSNIKELSGVQIRLWHTFGRITERHRDHFTAFQPQSCAHISNPNEKPAYIQHLLPGFLGSSFEIIFTLRVQLYQSAFVYS